jgi:hypothetical protein
LHNKAAVHPGQYADGPQRKKKKKKEEDGKKKKENKKTTQRYVKTFKTY